MVNGIPQPTHFGEEAETALQGGYSPSLVCVNTDARSRSVAQPDSECYDGPASSRARLAISRTASDYLQPFHTASSSYPVGMDYSDQAVRCL